MSKDDVYVFEEAQQLTCPLVFRKQRAQRHTLR